MPVRKHGTAIASVLLAGKRNPCLAKRQGGFFTVQQGFIPRRFPDRPEGLWEGFYQSADFIFALAEPGEFHVEHLGGILFFSFVLLGAVVMAPAVCVCCLLGLLFAILLPFGPSTVLANILAEVSVEPVPRGVWAVHQFASAGSIHESLTGLAHSASYHDPRVISLIARWIKGEDGKKLTRARQNLPDL